MLSLSWFASTLSYTLLFLTWPLFKEFRCISHYHCLSPYSSLGLSLVALALPLFLLENLLRILQVCNAANCPVLPAFMMTNSFGCCKKENPSLVCYSYIQSIVKEHNEIPISGFHACQFNCLDEVTPLRHHGESLF